MKVSKTIFTAFAALLVYGSAQAQQMPQKGDNIILIETAQPPAEAFKAVMRKLAMDGVSVAQSNNEILTIETEWLPVGKLDLSIRYFLFVEDAGGKSIIRIRGEFTSPSLGASRVEFRGMNGSMFMRSWEKSIEFANGLGMGETNYLKG